MTEETATTPESDLAAQFLDSASGIITVAGRQVRAAYQFEADPGDILVVTRLTANRQRDEAVKISARAGNLAVASTRSPTIDLWSSTAPRLVELTVESDTPTVVSVWNAWRFGGIEHAWIGNSGFIVSTDEERTTLQCSDGIGPVDFTDLIVTIEHRTG